MPRLIALALRPGPAYKAAIERTWEAGDAIAPLDPRLPDPEQRRVLAALRPDAIMDDTGRLTALEGGVGVAPGDALVIATSGTSAEPKGVVHTHRSIAASALATSTMLGVDPLADRWLACLPLAHIGGLSVVLRSIVTGTRVEIHDGFDPKAVMAAADDGATLVSLVSTALQRVPVDRFRLVLLGGSRPPEHTADNVIATYGMTETGSGVLYRHNGRQRVLDGVELRIDEADQIWVRGPMLLRCYRDGTDPSDGNGWFPTGDLGSWSEGGELSVSGRAGDVIVTGSEKVWPADIERSLAERDDVADAAIVGMPDPEWGQRVVAVVVPTDAQSPPTLDQLRGHIKDRFAPWSAPKELVLVSSIPRTSLGKIRRHQLVNDITPVR